VEPVAKVVSSGPCADLPLLQWLSADHSLNVPIGSMLFTNPTPKPMTDFDIRGKLSTLKCWHRLSGDEVQDLIEFAQNQQSK
jgi:hypothetical protein